MSNAPTCSKCGTALPGDAPEGLCPKCLVVAGLMSEIPSDPQETVDFTAQPAAANWPPAAEPSVEHVFGGYRIIRPLGKGGMGTVYEAEETASGRRLALKVLSHSLDSEQARARFFREGRLAASINDPNTVYIFGTEEINALPVITMELVPGGTLQELVQRQGPLPIPQAVDAILQIIAGLQAAAAGGVLHRDIKPSNCFLDPDGTVKVGDFGLSISTLARAETNVTTTGAMVGTPAFASPEQLRGDELDTRSDIYAVGVTLHYLLTGQTPFKADNVVRLLATVLERPAESPRKLRPEIPEELAAVVLRCLAKQPAQRFRNYEELRQALLPFTSTAPVPATLSIRFLAGLIDQVIPGLGNMALIILLLPLARSADSRVVSPEQGGLGYVSMILLLLYYALPEGLWGASAGKAICRLRVINPQRNRPNLPRAFLRAAIFLFTPVLIQRLAYFFLGSEDGSSWSSAGSSRNIFLLVSLQLAVLALMFSTMRRSNGYAGVHDLLSGMRVIFKPHWQTRPTAAVSVEPQTLPPNLPHIGPYHVLAELDPSGGAGTLLGYDARLFRKVWIRQRPKDASDVAPSLRIMARRGRLRWLAGKRTPEENWDAYEALTGQSLTALLGVPQTWKQVRFWLLDLAEELAAGQKDQSLPAVLGLDRVWITADGRAKLLDFAAPGSTAGAGGGEHNAPAEPASRGPVNDHEAQLFLKQVAIAALEGRMTEQQEMEGYVPRVPLPLHGRSFLSALPAVPTFDAELGELRGLMNRIAEISRGRRLALLAGCSAGLMFLLLAIPLVTLMNRQFQPHAAEIRELNACLVKLQLLKGKQAQLDPDNTKGRDLEVYIAGRFRGMVADPAFRESLEAQSSITGDRRQMAEQILKDHANDPPELVAEATARVKPTLDPGPKSTEIRGTLGYSAAIAGFLIAGSMILFFLVGLPAMLAAGLFRGGLLLHGLGLAVVTQQGAPASRGRVLWRAFITWIPLLWPVVSSILLLPLLGRTSPWISMLCVLIALLPIPLFLGTALWSLRTPDRGLQDRLAGTRMVPR